MRKSQLSGIYYKSAATLLDSQLTEAFEGKNGPGAKPTQNKKRELNLQGIIVPHYKYELSASCAAWAYNKIAEKGTPDVIIIIGQTEKNSGITTEPYETPYGIIRVDQPLARAIIEKGNIQEDNPLFNNDTFIESQLPLIQYTYKKNMETIKILPMLLGKQKNYRELAADIKEALMDQKKKAVIIVPTNFTKYGPNFGYVPFSTETHKNVLELDIEAIKLIQQNKPKELLEYIDEKAMNTDNILGIILALLIIKPNKVLLEQYNTTTDIDNDQKNFTSFAAIILEK